MKKLTLLLILVFSMAGQAMGAEWHFYGSSRISTFYQKEEYISPGYSYNSSNFYQALQGNVRIGAKINVSEQLTGRVELGSKAEPWPSEGGTHIRLLYGEWHFGNAALLVGQAYPPTYLPVSNQVYMNDLGLNNWGEFNPGRIPQIKFTMGNLQFAALEPQNTFVYGADTKGAKLPRLEASYHIDLTHTAINLAGGYQIFDTVVDQEVSAHVVIGRVETRAGIVRLGAQAFIGQNIGLLGGYQMVTADWDGQQMHDAESYGGNLVAGVSLSDMVAFEAGVGLVKHKQDTADDQEWKAFYFQIPLTLAPGVLIVPEVGCLKASYYGYTFEETYLGAKWQIDF